ncbi:pectinesterase family protein [Paenibacillus sp. YSY-4.3]
MEQISWQLSEPIIVGKQSICHFQSIQAAIDFLELPGLQSAGAVQTLYIMSGIYEENVLIYRSHLRIIGLGYVEITGGKYARELDEHGERIETFGTPTLFLGGSDLVLENIVVSNTAGQGPEIGQAVAVYAHCDKAVFRNCSFKGHQDTLFTGPLPPAPRERAEFGGIPLREHHANYRQLYQHCYIEGTVDFIFGGATAYFEGCEMRSLRHYEGQSGYVTAASTPQGQKHGYVFHRCFLTAAPGVSDVYLGRPWREYARTAYVNCVLGEHIHPRGWDNWNDSANEKTVCYEEYCGDQAGSLRLQRVSWAGCCDTDPEELRMEQVFAGTNFWKREEEQNR